MSKRDRATFEERDLGSLLESGEHSDFAIICKGAEWKVHKNILCLRSKFFATLCKNDCVESREGKVIFADDDPVVVGRMLNYLYTGAIEYGQDLDEQDQASVTKQMLEILAVYVLGDKYDILGLRRYCRSLFEALAQEAESFCLFELVVDAASTIPQNDQELLEDIIQFCAINMEHIFNPTPDSNTLHTTFDWNQIFHEHAVFATRLFQAVTAQSFNKAKIHEDRVASLKAEHHAENQSLLRRFFDLELELQASQNARDLYRRMYTESVERVYGSTRTSVLRRPYDTYPGSGTV